MVNIIDFLRRYDFSIYYYLYNHGLNSALFGKLFYLFARYGIVIFLFSFAYLIWMKKINAFICSFIAMTIGGLLDLIIFMFWQRPRPFVSHGLSLPYRIDEMAERISSFPSSHTYIIFAIATSVFLYGHKKLGSVLFILAIMTAASRIGTGLHYPSDTIGGAILGILSGYLAYRFVRKNEGYWEYHDET